ncbi:MAG: PAS domain S-box protein, partial [Acidobacteriota bacterium]|nr:PAS domain S-box protein [Acidobacteriota bacterium]
MAPAATNGSSDDAVSLRRCVRELAALSTLSAVWSKNDLPQIADGLAGVLLRALPIDIVGVRLRGADGNIAVETARTPRGPISDDHLGAFSRGFDDCGDLAGGATTINNPLGGGLLRVVTVPLGYGSDCGTLVAGAEQADFPTQTDRLMLGVACNQATIVLQQRRSQQQLRRSEQELADFFENATIGLHWVAADGTILRANRAELDLLGYAVDEYVGHHIAEFHVDREVIDDILRRLRAGERVRDREARMRCKDGSFRHVTIDSSVLWEDGRFIHTRCFTRDVTEQKRVEEIRRRLAAIVESSGDAIISEDLNGIVTSWNHGAEAIYGYTASEIVGRPFATLVPPERIDELPTILGRLSRGTPIAHYESVRIAKDGRRIDVSLMVSPILDDSGRIQGISKIARDITPRKRAEGALRRQSERLALLWEAASVLLVASDPDTMLRGLLDKFGAHLGIDAYFHYLAADSGDRLSLSSYQGISADAARELECVKFEDALCDTVAVQRTPLVISAIQQSSEPVPRALRPLGIRSYACNPLLAGDRLLGALSFASRTKDRFDADEVACIETICHYVAVALERLRLLDALQESDRRKDEFLATLAHELRNPLAPIRNSVQVLHLQGSQAPEARRSRAVIERQVDHLTRLIDDLLEVSRITRNQLELRKQRVALADVVAGAIEASRPLIESSGHTLTVSLPSEPVYLDGDVVRLSQVILNLLNNAAKYTEPSGRIDLTAERNGSTATIRVKDTGVGIPADKLPLVFEMFFQADRSRERAKGGLGIGLALARQLAEAHGGCVEARSDGIGTGSEFIVRLPVLSDETEPPSAPSQPAGRSAAQTATILVVDDNRDSADSLSAFLRLKGNEVFNAYDGIDAVDAAERHRPEVVLLDIGMPRLNGEDACRRIRSQPWGVGMTLIALTGWGQEEDRRRTLDAGFDAHFTKPDDP